jgi:hypothetical protein
VIKGKRKNKKEEYRPKKTGEKAKKEKKYGRAIRNAAHRAVAFSPRQQGLLASKPTLPGPKSHLSNTWPRRNPAS